MKYLLYREKQEQKNKQAKKTKEIKKKTKTKNKQTKITIKLITSLTIQASSICIFLSDPKVSICLGLQKISSSWLNISIYLNR